MINAQSLQVDTISGATASSKVILEAIELALKNGISG
ncbi:MAG: FMN-binding protein [Candidatus Marinimicrobia bacterium]|nr:FMN-binding protein [Candidatus Neomarinimicrobiota bacterium]